MKTSLILSLLPIFVTLQARALNVECTQNLRNGEEKASVRVMINIPAGKPHASTVKITKQVWNVKEVNGASDITLASETPVAETVTSCIADPKVGAVMCRDTYAKADHIRQVSESPELSVRVAGVWGVVRISDVETGKVSQTLKINQLVNIYGTKAKDVISAFGTNEFSDSYCSFK